MKKSLVLFLFLLQWAWAQGGATTEQQLVDHLAYSLRDNSIENAMLYAMPETLFLESRKRFAEANPGKMAIPESDVKKMYAQLALMADRSWTKLQQQWHNIGIVPGSIQLQRYDMRQVGTQMGIRGLEGGMLKLYLSGQDANGNQQVYPIQIDVIRMDGSWYWVGEFIPVME